jgi:hypothetical protein
MNVPAAASAKSWGCCTAGRELHPALATLNEAGMSS